MAKDEHGPQEGFEKIVELFSDVDRKLAEIKGLILEVNTRRTAGRFAGDRDGAAAAQAGGDSQDGRRSERGGADTETQHCSFCGKGQHEVAKLIAGPDVFICDDCVEICADITRVEKKLGED